MYIFGLSGTHTTCTRSQLTRHLHQWTTGAAASRPRFVLMPGLVEFSHIASKPKSTLSQLSKAFTPHSHTTAHLCCC